MRSLRFLALLIAFGAVSVFPARVYGQQEVDPDHFDQSSVKSSKSHTTAQAHHRAQPVHARIASRHAGGREHHHSAPVVS